MQISHVFSELGTGLRRNLSMTISLIVTTMVSLLLAGLGLLIQMQSSLSEQHFGDVLQIQVSLCSENSLGGNCINGAATDQEKEAAEEALDDNPEVESWEFESSQEAYDKAEALFTQSDNGRRLFETVDVEDFAESYLVVLNDPLQFEGVQAQMSGMDGVSQVVDLRDQLEPIYTALSRLRLASLTTAGLLVVAAVLQVSNAIRLAAYARRREIGIMRLVGASSWHIQLPFVLESLVACLIAGLLAGGALAAFTQFVIYGFLRPKLRITPWVGWSEMALAGGGMMVFAFVLAIVPTLVVSRKYLNV